MILSFFPVFKWNDQSIDLSCLRSQRYVKSFCVSFTRLLAIILVIFTVLYFSFNLIRDLTYLKAIVIFNTRHYFENFIFPLFLNYVLKTILYNIITSCSQGITHSFFSKFKTNNTAVKWPSIFLFTCWAGARESIYFYHLTIYLWHH